MFPRSVIRKVHQMCIRDRVYMSAAVGVTPDRPILIDRFLHHATECEADAISDGKNCFVPAVMEHIELAGVHSGDSACILPSLNLTEKQVTTIKDYTKKIAVEMNVCGLMNMQYAIEDDTVYVLEANPRASRTDVYKRQIQAYAVARFYRLL